MNAFIHRLKKVPLIQQIAVGLVIGILIAVFLPGVVPVVSIFGDLFVSALKGVAPLLVFILVMNAMVQRKEGGDTNMKPIITLYVIGTFAASIVGVTLSFLFPQTLVLQLGNSKVNPPSGIAEVVHNLIMNIVDSPVHALLTANYIGILAWAVIIGMALHTCAGDETKRMLKDLSEGITKVVTWVIHLAPLGIMGLVTQSISASGLSAIVSYFSLLGVLLSSYFLVALVMNPLIVYLNVHKNPYPAGLGHH
jgi:serine/threonine transporter